MRIDFKRDICIQKIIRIANRIARNKTNTKKYSIYTPHLSFHINERLLHGYKHGELYSYSRWYFHINVPAHSRHIFGYGQIDSKTFRTRQGAVMYLRDKMIEKLIEEVIE